MEAGKQLSYTAPPYVRRYYNPNRERERAVDNGDDEEGGPGIRLGLSLSTMATICESIFFLVLSVLVAGDDRHKLWRNPQEPLTWTFLP
ncbi:hypothetical protein TIFTF001_019020 [Ficus carica]|uniref:Uncharacterized protein n=1 Tax=Ficus carica TaxID=3494 RepID=A0AA88AWA7_FICCA|nr:hypothetical protein TIFTF001_019020 [Ficus carica]